MPRRIASEEEVLATVPINSTAQVYFLRGSSRFSFLTVSFKRVGEAFPFPVLFSLLTIAIHRWAVLVF
jgi:hypothetical protein